MPAEQVLETGRGHRKNGKSHWTLDVMFGGNAGKTGSGHAAENLNVLRQIAHDVLKSLPGLEDRVPVRPPPGRQDALQSRQVHGV